jgi:hypothetical protein
MALFYMDLVHYSTFTHYVPLPAVNSFSHLDFRLLIEAPSNISTG